MLRRPRFAASEAAATGGAYAVPATALTTDDGTQPGDQQIALNN